MADDFTPPAAPSAKARRKSSRGNADAAVQRNETVEQKGKNSAVKRLRRQEEKKRTIRMRGETEAKGRYLRGEEQEVDTDPSAAMVISAPITAAAGAPSGSALDDSDIASPAIGITRTMSASADIIAARDQWYKKEVKRQRHRHRSTLQQAEDERDAYRIRSGDFQASTERPELPSEVRLQLFCRLNGMISRVTKNTNTGESEHWSEHLSLSLPTNFLDVFPPELDGLPEPKAVAQADLIARIRQELQRIYDQSMVTLRQCRVPGQRKPVHLTADHKDRVQRLHTVDKAVTAVIDALNMAGRSDFAIKVAEDHDEIYTGGDHNIVPSTSLTFDCVANMCSALSSSEVKAKTFSHSPRGLLHVRLDDSRQLLAPGHVYLAKCPEEATTRINLEGRYLIQHGPSARQCLVYTWNPIDASYAASDSGFSQACETFVHWLTDHVDRLPDHISGDIRDDVLLTESEFTTRMRLIRRGLNATRRLLSLGGISQAGGSNGGFKPSPAMVASQHGQYILKAIASGLPTYLDLLQFHSHIPLVEAACCLTKLAQVAQNTDPMLSQETVRIMNAVFLVAIDLKEDFLRLQDDLKNHAKLTDQPFCHTTSGPGNTASATDDDGALGIWLRVQVTSFDRALVHLLETYLAQAEIEARQFFDEFHTTQTASQEEDTLESTGSYEVPNASCVELLLETKWKILIKLAPLLDSYQEIQEKAIRHLNAVVNQLLQAVLTHSMPAQSSDLDLLKAVHTLESPVADTDREQKASRRLAARAAALGLLLKRITAFCRQMSERVDRSALISAYGTLDKLDAALQNLKFRLLAPRDNTGNEYNWIHMDNAGGMSKDGMGLSLLYATACITPTTQCVEFVQAERVADHEKAFSRTNSMVDMASVEMSDAFLEGSSQAPEAHWVLTVIPFKSAVEVVQALQEEDMDSVAIIDERFPYRLGIEQDVRHTRQELQHCVECFWQHTKRVCSLPLPLRVTNTLEQNTFDTAFGLARELVSLHPSLCSLEGIWELAMAWCKAFEKHDEQLALPSRLLLNQGQAFLEFACESRITRYLSVDQFKQLQVAVERALDSIAKYRERAKIDRAARREGNMPAASKDFVRLADGRMALAPLQQRPESARAPKMPLSYLNDMHSQGRNVNSSSGRTDSWNPPPAVVGRVTSGTASSALQAMDYVVEESSFVNPWAHLSPQRQLGGGSFGKVYVVKDLKQDRLMAMKEFFPWKRQAGQNQAVVGQAAGGDESAYKRVVESEWRSVAALKHDNLAESFGVQYVRTSPTVLLARLFMPYYSKKSLNALYPDLDNNKLPIENIRSWIKGVLQGLDYLHTQGRIAHYDIKPQNIFLDRKDVPKVGDFGQCQKILTAAQVKAMDPDLLRQRYQARGTALYMPPEYRQEQIVAQYGAQSDVWAVGCVLIWLFNGRVHFKLDAYKDQNLEPHIVQYFLAEGRINPPRPHLPEAVGQVWPKWVDAIRSFLDACFKPYDQRPGCAELLKQAFVA